MHVDNASCHFAAEFLDCLNLQQHVDIPTHSRGYTLDHVISNSTPISNLLVHDLGVSDHKAISMERTHQRQICYRDLKKINQDILTIDLQNLSSADFSSVSESV